VTSVVVYHGTEGTIQIGSTEIGLVQDFSVDLDNSLDDVLTMGTRAVDQHREGHQIVTGTLTKAWINSDLMNYATASGYPLSGELITFNMFLQPNESDGIPTSGIPYIKLFDCKVSTASIKAPHDDIHMEDIEFKARYMDHVPME